MKVFYSIIKYLFFLTLTAILLSALGLFTAMHLLFDDKAEITQFEKASLADIKRIKKIAIEVSGQLNQQGVQQIVLSERDLNLGISHFAPGLLQLPKNSFARIAVTEQQQAINVTIPANYVSEQFYLQTKHQLSDNQRMAFNLLKDWVSNKWVNATLNIAIDNDAETGQWIKPSRIRVGAIKLNESLSQSIADTLIAEALKQPTAKPAILAWGNIKGIQHKDNEITIDYTLPNTGQSALSSYQSLLLSPDEQQLISIYETQLEQLPKRGQLVSLIAPLFEFALTRSKQSNNPVAENRAALLTLAKYFGGDDLTSMLSTNTIANFQANAKPYTIYGRRDLAQHMVLSAGLTLVADEGLAELIGLDKEISDLMGGKTISAWDLLADKAGVRLAQNATRSAKSARQLQIDLAKARRDEHILPDLGADFSYSSDRFSIEDIDELSSLVNLYLEELDILKP